MMWKLSKMENELSSRVTSPNAIWCVSLWQRSIKCPSLLSLILCTNHYCTSILKGKKNKSSKALASGALVHRWVSWFKLLRNLYQHYILKEKAERNPEYHSPHDLWGEKGVQKMLGENDATWYWGRLSLVLSFLSKIHTESEKAGSDPDNLV